MGGREIRAENFNDFGHFQQKRFSGYGNVHKLCKQFLGFPSALPRPLPYRSFMQRFREFALTSKPPHSPTPTIHFILPSDYVACERSLDESTLMRKVFPISGGFISIITTNFYLPPDTHQANFFSGSNLFCSFYPLPVS